MPPEPRCGPLVREASDLQRFTADAKSLQSTVNGELAQAQYQQVKVKVGDMSNELATIMASLQAEHGDSSRLAQVNAALSRLDSDAAALDSICLPGV